MSKIRIASVAPRMKLSDPEANLNTLTRWAKRAADERVDLVLFPETFITGYGMEEMYQAGYATKETFLSLAQPIPGPITDQLLELSRSLGLFICAGLLEKDAGRLFNTQVMIDPDTQSIGRYRKIQIGSSERWFSESGGEFPIFDVRGVPTGILICKDKSHPEIARILALEGAQLLLNPHATFLPRRTPPNRRTFREWSLKICAVRAVENGCYLIANNSAFDCPIDVDMQEAYNFAIDPFGEVIHCDIGLGDTEKFAVITVDTDVVRQRREMEGKDFNLFSRIPGVYQRLVRVD